MGWLRDSVIDERRRAAHAARAGSISCMHPNDLANLRGAVRKGDVVLVDGDQRISEVIKYLTQSSWSHAALYVGDELLRRFPRAAKPWSISTASRPSTWSSRRSWRAASSRRRSSSTPT